MSINYRNMITETERPITCRNCEKEFEGNFCYHCGQKSSVGRINGRQAVEDIVNHVLNMEKGFLFTAKELFIRPERVVHDYLWGKRVTYYHPLKYLLLILSVTAFLTFYFDVLNETYTEMYEKSTILLSGF